MLAGENGIIRQAQQAKDKTEEAKIQEQVKMAIVSASMTVDRKINIAELQNEFSKIGGSITSTNYPIKGTVGGMDVTINEDASFTIEESIDWEKIKQDALANPDKYKHEEQKSTNKDIGIGTDGKVVNMDLWEYTIINSNEILLASGQGTDTLPGYSDTNITDDGKIIGTVPQYIQVNGEGDFLPVTAMEHTFAWNNKLKIAPEIPPTVKDLSETFEGCRNLTTAPSVIPSNVTDMDHTFSGCNSLITGPTIIPESVTNMYYTFYNCNKLSGEMEINAKPNIYGYCFEDASFVPAELKLTGSGDIDKLIDTKSPESNIYKANN